MDHSNLNAQMFCPLCGKPVEEVDRQSEGVYAVPSLDVSYYDSQEVFDDRGPSDDDSIGELVEYACGACGNHFYINY